MKTETKRKILRFAENFARNFALYAIMPIICVSIIVLMIAVNSFGAEDIEKAAASVGDKSVSTLLGEAVKKKSGRASFYFISPEISFPIKTDAEIIKGNKLYYNTVNPETENSEIINDMVIYDKLPNGANPVIKCNLASNSYYLNQTKFSIDIDSARNTSFPVQKDTDTSEPVVLIVHTHGTECYLDDNNNLSSFAPEGIDGYFVEKDMAHRTTDTSKNVVRIGEVFCEELNKNGINAIQCKTMHDEKSYNAAYSNSAKAVKEYLKKYPSIRYVIDIHRDSITRDNKLVKTYTEIGGVPTAQVMLVVGSNQNGNHPNWLSNLTVATLFKDSLDSMYPSLARPMYIRTGKFNQELCKGSLLLEVGSTANTLKEAETAAVFAAKAFCDMLGK